MILAIWVGYVPVFGLGLGTILKSDRASMFGTDEMHHGVSSHRKFTYMLNRWF